MDLIEALRDHSDLMQHYRGSGTYYGHDDDFTHKTGLHKSVDNYSGMHSTDINNYLWKKHQFTEHSPFDWGSNDKYKNKAYIENIEEHIHHIDEGMARNHVPKNITVYSGTPHNIPEHENINGIVHHPAYLSTSIHPKKAMRFAKAHMENTQTGGDAGNAHVLKINVPKGHPGLYVPGVLKHSENYDTERELLLPRGLNLKRTKTTVHDIPAYNIYNRRKYFHKIDGGYTDKNDPKEERLISHRLHIHHMEIV